MTNLAMIGVGRMGEAVLAGLIKSGWPTADLSAVESHEASAKNVRETHGVNVVAVDEAVIGADVVVIAVKPHDVVAVLGQIHDHLSPTALVISLAAGLPTDILEAHLPPGTAVVRVMPNTPALLGQGMSVLSPGSNCSGEGLGQAERVMGAVGRVAQVGESAQDAVTAVSGSGPAYVFYVAEAMIDAGVLMGLPRPLATELAIQTLFGSASMLRESTHSAAVLRENVTSPGGTTAAALQVLDEEAVKAAMAKAMLACRARSAELAQIARAADAI